MKNFVLHDLDRDIEDIFYKYVKVKSDTFTRYEKDAQEFLQGFFRSLSYFKAHPEHFGYYEIKDDPLNRALSYAFVKGEGSNTVVLIHHNDVVGVEDFKTLKEFAYSPEKLNTELLKIKDNLLSEAREDLESGDYIFGRGTADMKAGGAVQLAIIKRLSEIDGLVGNVLLLSVPDEENLSSGMRGAISLLKELKNRYGLTFKMMINSEPHQRIDKNIGVLSEGSVGKIMPFVYVRGSLAHIGKVFEGFNPVGLLADIVSETELSLAFSDYIKAEASPPPTWLYLRDSKEHYDCSMPLSASGCFSILTLNKYPTEILEEIRDICKKTFFRHLESMNKKYEKFMINQQKPFSPLPWEVKVLTFSELYNEALKNHGGKFEKYYEEVLKEILNRINDGSLSMLESSIQIVDKVFNYIDDLQPRVVIGFSPPYYPNVSNIYFENLDSAAKGLSDKLIAYSNEKFYQKYTKEYFYTGISDLSYSSIKNSDLLEKTISHNMPLYGDFYSLPLKEIQEISMPCINIGPWGKDFHKITERVLKEDLLYRTPELLTYAISILLGW